MEETVKKIYEIGFLLESAEHAEIIKKALLQAGASITEESPVTERELAYTIKKKNRAFFGFIVFSAVTESMAGLESQLRMEANVIRFLITVRQLPSARRSERERRPQEKIKPAESTVLSNEDLAQRLEEILK
ncbi:MAG: 30S ribosomal protein S6 [Patescibacteria group bacterium]